MKALLVFDIDEKYIGSIGNEIKFINNTYKCNWKLKNIPEKKLDGGYWLDDEFNEGYRSGWNRCIEKIEN